MKKWLKIWLIVGWSLLIAGGGWASLTKVWIIPNRFEIETLCPKNFWVSVYGIDKYDNCIKKCWSYSIQLSWFSIEWYDRWYHDKYELWKRNLTPKLSDNYLFADNFYTDKYYNLIRNEHYQEWVDDVFSWNKDKISRVESQILENHNCKHACGANPRMGKARKPIIYLYPTEEIHVKVTLWTPKNLLHTYPKYNSEKWRNVVAQPNGDLENMETWRKLYALYREWITYNEDKFTEWFVVAWKDIIPFFEEKLALLWLNEREAEEFIVYWLPQMENNKYNLIRFETKEEQDENMPLNITPTPNTLIRVMMDWKAIEEPIEIPEQGLSTPERTWFTVVEWWGSPRN